MKNKPSYFPYLRVSTKAQAADSRTGFSRQLATIDSYCRKNAITATTVFSETWSGSETVRPEYQKLLKALKEGDTVLVESLDRFSRSFDGLAMALDLVAMGCDLLDCSSGESLIAALSNHPVMEFTFKLRFLVAEFEKNSIVHRLQHGLKRRWEKNGGKANNGRKGFYSDELKKSVKKMCRRMSLEQVAAKLNQCGQPSATGVPWTRRMVSRLAAN